ncbi:hypothetical protein WMY93_009238 [Mugilogobius chulae]|uniref:Uncharacterized protein n=1 Tax=Mugilogobius chulae TaxID=88201 RepID=A0AAW0PB77_9GOBI
MFVLQIWKCQQSVDIFSTPFQRGLWPFSWKIQTQHGGFTENFSRSQYFCRYCEIKRSEFESDPNACGPPRTPETYDAAVADLQTENIQDTKGVK